ncbi:MAG: hypothetical protein R6U44_01955 [Archaeoglobaceae archaeon]
MRCKLILCLIIAVAIVFSGCMTVSVHSKVSKDGDVDNYRMVINTSSMVYSTLSEQAKEEGYASLRESFTSNVSEEMKGNVTYDEKWSGDSVSIIIESHGDQPIEDGNLIIYREEDYLVYEDNFEGGEGQEEPDEYTKQMLSGFALHYYLEMPGKIVETNANTIEDNKAEWHLTGADAFNARIYAKSEIPAIPGFEMFIGLFALIASTLVISAKR